MINSTLQQWLKSLRTRPARKPHRAKLSLQGFEQRDVPSAAVCPTWNVPTCHVTVTECAPKPCDNDGGGKDCTTGSNGKGSGAKGSSGKGSGGKCDNGSKDKGSSGKGSGGKCDNGSKDKGSSGKGSGGKCDNGSKDKGSSGKGSGGKCDNGSKDKGSSGKGSGGKCDTGSKDKGSSGKGSGGKGNDRCDPPKPPVCETPKPVKQKGNNGVGNGLDGQPPGNPRINDGPGTSPGHPGNKGGKK